MATVLAATSSDSAVGQTKTEITEDHTYGNGIKKTITGAANNVFGSADVKETVREEFYDGSNPRKLMEWKEIIKYKDGSVEVRDYMPDAANDFLKRVKVDKKDFAGTLVRHEDYRSNKRGQIISGTKWEFDDARKKQEFVYDENEQHWQNKNDLPTSETFTTDDNTYGNGKKITTTIKKLSYADQHTSEKYINGAGKIMEEKITIKYKNGSVETTDEYYEDSRPFKGKTIKKDAMGNVVSESDFVIDPTSRVLKSGNKWELDASGTKVFYEFQKEKGWVEKPKPAKPKHDVAYEGGDRMALGPAWMHFGDKNVHYGSFGFSANYTHSLNGQFGLTADIGYYLHKDDNKIGNQDFSQTAGLFTLTAGAGFVPLSQGSGKLNFSAHLLAGLGVYTVKNNSGSYGSTSSSEKSFALNVGAAEEYRFNDHIGLALAANYVPTFLYESTQNNFRVDLLAVYHFGDH